MKGLIIRSPWIDLILAGKKTWEIRGQSTQKKEAIALIKSGTKTIVGVARIARVVGPFSSISDFMLHKEKHLTSEAELKDGLPYEKTYAWELADVVRLNEPVPYDHPIGSIIWVNLDNISTDSLLQINKSYRIPKAKQKEEFLRSIQKDLELLNGEVNYVNESSQTYDEFKLKTTHFRYQDKEQVGKIYKRIRDRLLLSNKGFILKMEEQKSILNYFGNGNEIEIEKISPEIRVCETQNEKDIFKYCRYLQDVPNTGGVGRRLSIIVYDRGQKNKCIMGIISLASSGYTLKCRDDYFGWNNRNIDSYKGLKELKDSGLRGIMQLAVSLAVPPYNYLYSGKLIALLAFSNPVQLIFQERYGQSLLAIITTSATGIHSSIYNRIQLRKVFNDERSRSELFDRIGETSEYSSLILSESTKKIANELVANYQSYSKSAKRNRNTFSSDGVINKAMQICGLNKEILEMNEKGVYLGSLHDNNIEILRGMDSEPLLNLTVEEAVQYWKNHLLPKFMEDKDSNHLFKNFKKDLLCVSGQLKLGL